MPETNNKNYSEYVLDTMEKIREKFTSRTLVSFFDVKPKEVVDYYVKDIQDHTESENICYFKVSEDNRIICLHSFLTKTCGYKCLLNGHYVDNNVEFFDNLKSNKRLYFLSPIEIKKEKALKGVMCDRNLILNPYVVNGVFKGFFLVSNFNEKKLDLLDAILDYGSDNVAAIIHQLYNLSFNNCLIKGVENHTDLSVLVDVLHKRYHIFNQNESLNGIFCKEGYWDEFVKTYVSLLDEQDQIRAARKLTMEYMVDHLSKDKKTFNFVVKRLVDNKFKWLKATLSVSEYDEEGNIFNIFISFRDETDSVLDSIERKRKFKDINESLENNLKIVQSLASMYFFTATVNLKEFYGKIITVPSEFNEYMNRKIPLNDGIKLFLTTVDEGYHEHLQTLLDLSMIHTRFHGRKGIFTEYLSAKKTWCKLALVPSQINEDGFVETFTIAVEDIDEEKTREELMIYRAEHDALTGVMNRSAFDKTIAYLKNYNKPLALLIIDVDYFKSVNDFYGHNIGDKALKRVADVLVSHFDSDDAIIRLGGDEFCVIMTNISRKYANTVVERIKAINEILANPVDDLPSVSISVGVDFTTCGYSDELFNNADKALYLTKNTSKSGCTIYKQKK